MADLIPRLIYATAPAVVVDFTYPPKVDDGDAYETKSKEAESISGVLQVSNYYIEARRKIKLSFITEAQKAVLETFFLKHGGLGKPFKWYTDKDDSTFTWYTLSRKLVWKKLAPVGARAFIYEVDLEFRRALDLFGDAEMSIPIVNNQATPLTLPGIVVDNTKLTSFFYLYEIRRKTDSSERVATGTISLAFRQASNTWDISDTRNGDDMGVTFSVTSPGGQLQYVSDNQTGANYIGSLIVK